MNMYSDEALEAESLRVSGGSSDEPQSPPAGDELNEILEKLNPYHCYYCETNAPPVHVHQINRNPSIKDQINAYILSEIQKVIGEDEIEYSNLDGDAGYWEKHGRNELRAEQRQALTAKFGRSTES